MTTSQIISEPLHYEEIFETRYFKIVPELIAAEHSFRFKGYDVSVTLPSKRQVERKNEDFCLAAWDAWRIIDGEEVPCEYIINAVFVRIQVAERVTLPAEIAQRHANAFDLLDEVQTQSLEGLCAQYNALATEAFRYWLNIVRWASDYYKLGRESVEWVSIHRKPTLCIAQTGKRIWGPTTTIRFRGSPRIKQDLWDKAGRALRASASVPTYWTLLHDAEEYLERQEFRRSILDIAIACEVYMRTQVLDTLPNGLAPSLVKAIEDMNINQYVQNHFPQIVASTEQSDALKSIKKELGSLFSARNEIMHMAKTHRATQPECERFIRLARKLFSVGIASEIEVLTAIPTEI